MTGPNRRQALVGGAFALLAAATGAARAGVGPERLCKAMVAAAIQLFNDRSVGAFRDFEDPKNAMFHSGDIYIVVQSRGAYGTVQAHGADPALDGTLLDKIVDPTGKKFGVIMSNEATPQGGWFDYEWLDPTTGKPGHKRSWAVEHQGLVFIAGYYVR